MSEFDDIEIELVGCESTGEDSEPAESTVKHEAGHLDVDLEEDRYSRFRLIPWWDQKILKKAKIFVVGAGALGNEIVKNLSLLGIGNILVCDMDIIENSNLSRSIMFRASDEGKSKAEVITRSAMGVNPDVNAHPIIGNVIHDIGLGVFRAFDIVMAGLDNREARLHINQSCWKVTRPFIDGAIEVLNGEARVFMPPDSACYECTMNDADRNLISIRRSCSLATRSQLMQGHIPTTPTTSSVIAGIQCQEAVKILHNNPKDLPVLAGKGFYFNGLVHDSFIKVYQRRDDCMSHVTYENIEETNWKASDTKIGDVLETVRSRLGKDAVVDLEHEMVHAIECKKCGKTEPYFALLSRMTDEDEKCPECGEIRIFHMMHTLDGSIGNFDMTLSEIGIPLLDIVSGRSEPIVNETTGEYEFKTIHFELTGDRPSVLGWLK